MRIFVGAAATALMALTGSASAQQVNAAGAVIQGFGLVGTWANDCHRDLDKHQAGFRMIFAVPEKGPPTRTVITSDGAHKTTTKADILGAQPLGTSGLVIQARITGGDRDGGPLPGSAMTSGLDQSFEKTVPNVLFLKGRDPVRLEKCPEPVPVPAPSAAPAPAPSPDPGSGPGPNPSADHKP